VKLWNALVTLAEGLGALWLLAVVAHFAGLWLLVLL
jgi:hypothetical protein